MPDDYPEIVTTILSRLHPFLYDMGEIYIPWTLNFGDRGGFYSWSARDLFLRGPLDIFIVKNRLKNLYHAEVVQNSEHHYRFDSKPTKWLVILRKINANT